MAYFAVILGIVGFGAAVMLYNKVKQQPVGNEVMADIADSIHSGAMAFLRREYRVLAIFVGGVFMLILAGMGFQTALAFLGGAACSMTCGLSIEKTSTLGAVSSTIV